MTPAVIRYRAETGMRFAFRFCGIDPVTGVVPTFSASPRASNVASALPTAPDDLPPSLFAMVPGVNAVVGSLASCSATMRRSSPLRSRVVARGAAVTVPVVEVVPGVVMRGVLS